MPVLRAGEDEPQPGWAAMLCCGAVTSSKETQPRAEVLHTWPDASTEEQTAADVVETFCEHVPATRVEPTPAELESLWMKCSDLRAVIVAQALADQLTKATGEQNWQAQVRALHVLTYLYTKGHGGKQIAQVVMNSARDLLQHLAKETEECHRGANLALLVAQLTGVVPPGEELNIANEGGLMYFMGGDSRNSDSSVGGLVEASHDFTGTANNSRPCEQAEQQMSSTAVETSVDLLSLSEAVEAAPVAPASPLAASVQEQDLICLAASVRQQDLISLDAPPIVVDRGKHHVHVTQASTGVRVQAQELAGISWERSPNTPAAKPNFGANLGGQRSSQLTNRMAGIRPRSAAYIPLVTDQFMEEQLPRRDPFASLAEHVHHQLKSC